MSYDDYDLNPLRLALDLASLGVGALSFAQLIDRQQLMLTDHGYRPVQAPPRASADRTRRTARGGPQPA